MFAKQLGEVGFFEPLRSRHRRQFSAINRAITEVLEDRRLLAAHIVGNATNYATIQAAVNAAAAGATIDVDAGTYPEQVVVSKTLTIRGARSGIDARSNLRGSNESIVTGANVTGTFTSAFKIGASNVVLDGFTVQGETSQSTTNGAGIVITPNQAGTKIINNIVQNNVAGIFLSNNSSTNAALIQHNVFRGNNNPGQKGGRGIYTNGQLSGGTLTNVTIDENFFFDNRGSTGTTGLEAAIAFESLTVGTQTNLRVTNNIFDSNGKAVLAYNANNLMITGNVVTNVRDTTSGGLRFEGGDNTVTIQNNNLYGSGARAIRIDKKASTANNTTFVITNNNIYTNGLGTDHSGLYVNAGQYTGNLDARNNWWGASNGPSGDGGGSGDALFANGSSVTFSPFAATPVRDQQTPYYGASQNVDAVIQFEDFDHGTETVAYHDAESSNLGGKLHTYQGVDIQTTIDAGGGYNVAYVKAGEWIEYGVKVPQSGTYNLDVRIANSQTTGGKYHVEIDGANVTGAITAPNTGGTQTWQTQTKTGVSLTAGLHLLRFAFDTNGNGGSISNFNWFKFTNTTVTPVPAAPGNLVATAASSSQINLTWSDNSIDETGFKIERGTDGVNFTQIATPAANAVSYNDTTGLSAGTKYYYRIRATNGGGDSAYSNIANATTATPPPPPGAVYLSDLPFATTPTNGYGPVERDKSNGGSGAGDGKTITLNGVTYAKGLGSHAISDIAFNLGGAYSAFMSDIGVDDETGPGTVVFQVFADNGKIFDSGIMTQTALTQSINLNITGVQQLRLHVDNGGDNINYDHADWAGARVMAAAASVPAAPTGLAATPFSASQINLAWSDVATETGYTIERSTDNVSFAPAGTAAADVITFSDTTVSGSTVFSYRVRATNSGGASQPSNVASSAPLQKPAAPSNLVATGASTAQINLTWQDSSTNEVNFILERSPDGSTGWTQIATPAANATGYNDTNRLLPSTTYFYRLRATNSAGDSDNSNTASGTTSAPTPVPADPSNLAATATSVSQINLTWSDNSSDETGFKLERGTDGVNFAPLATPAANATSYSDTSSLQPGTKYYYRIRATNNVGDSNNSNIASATTFVPTSVTYIPTGATWKYLDNGSNQGTVWRTTGFADGAWKSGAAQLGYGDGDEATVVSYGPNSSAKYTTTYFRGSFAVADSSAVSALNLRILRDDGAVVYLNGTEVYRTNMPTGTIAYNTFASAAIEDNTFYAASINPALLVAGTNVIAVEIHQGDLTSSDISFDFELKATVTQPPAPAANFAVASASPTTLVLSDKDKEAILQGSDNTSII